MAGLTLWLWFRALFGIGKFPEMPHKTWAHMYKFYIHYIYMFEKLPYLINNKQKYLKAFSS